jgi:hypothetical protein
MLVSRTRPYDDRAAFYMTQERHGRMSEHLFLACIQRVSLQPLPLSVIRVLAYCSSV